MTRQARLSALIFPFFVCCLLLSCTSPIFAQTATAGQIIISEFRLRGSAGDDDEFIEIYNNSGADHVVTSLAGSTGYGVVASDGLTRCTIPNDTLIPNKGHFLCVNATAYSLALYATADASYSTDISLNAGIAIFNNNDEETGYIAANLLDAVGSTSEVNALFREGAGYTPVTPASLHQSFYRDLCGKGGNVTSGGLCTNQTPKDTNDNAADFVYVNTVGSDVGHGQRLGAPGPENLSSPIQRNADIPAFLLDATKGVSSVPNQQRDHTPGPPIDSTLGTLSLRRRFVNNTGANMTGLRFRIVDTTTLLAPAGFADLRARSSLNVTINNINDSATCMATGTPSTPPCEVSVLGTFLEVPPTQTIGGGFNSTLAAGTVIPQVPLAPGSSINLQFLLGVQQNGNFRFYVNVEALTGAILVDNAQRGPSLPPGGASLKVRNGMVLPAQMENARQTLSPSKDTPVWLAVVPAFKSENLSRLEITAPPAAKEIETPVEATQPEVAPIATDAGANLIEGTTSPEPKVRLARDPKAAFKEMLGQFGSLKETPDGFQVVVPESIWTSPRTATLVVADASKLDSLAKLLAGNLNYGIAIDVYTDNNGDTAALKQLTEARARVLQEWLQAAGVAASRIHARGLGGSNSPATKTTASEQARNRRIELTLTLMLKQ